jgi:ribosomal protein S18 acetylase RimI-like enzyme
VSAAVEITRHGAEVLNELEPLWLTLKDHHGACTPDLPIHDDATSWRMRRAEYADWLQQDGAFVLVARNDERAIGFALVRPHGPGPTWIAPQRYAIIQDLAVAADAQGGGIGRQLIERVHDESGCELVQLDVLSANDSARRFYERLGFGPWAITLRRARQ